MRSFREIFLIHHSHTDFGYTDAPSTIHRQQIAYIDEAVRLTRQTEDFPEAARFRWTCEVMLPVRDFIAQATPAQRRGFDRAFHNGQIELGAMPANMTGLMTREELGQSLADLAPLFRKFRPRVLFQNDVNGFAWGILPPMRKLGARFVWMGINSYSGFSPCQRPALWWWEGPDASRTLTFLGMSYTFGLDLFHAEEWRRGPIPSVEDVWYHAPEGRDIFDERPTALLASHTNCQRVLARDFAHWPYPEIAVQVTNAWRCDNDPPCAQLPKFVRAWNAAGLQPALRLTTPSVFMEHMARQHGKNIPSLRGDWQDWWDDGAASMPTELIASQRAKRILTDLAGGRKALRARKGGERLASEAWQQALLFSEHTFNTFDSLPRPYSATSLGHRAQKSCNAFQALEDATLARAEIIRSSPAYIRSSKAGHVAVINPGETSRSGWAVVKATALRGEFNAVRDVESGREISFEDIHGPQWSSADASLPRPFEVPDDAWNFGVQDRRFFVANLAPGATRIFEFCQINPVVPPSANLNGNNDHFSWKWNSRKASIDSLTDDRGKLLFDPDAGFSPGVPIIEAATGFGARSKLLKRLDPSIERRTPHFDSVEVVPSPASARFERVWSDPEFHRIAQTWDIFHDCPIVEITTTFWARETTAPQAVLLALPFRWPRARAVYDSLGWPTDAGPGQLPGSCGEHLVVGAGIEYQSRSGTLAVAMPDTPLACLGGLHLRTARRAAKPENQHLYPLVSNSYWLTNFSNTKAAKFTVCLRFSSRLPLAELNGDLWGFPCRQK